MSDEGAKKSGWQRFIPIGILVLGLILFFALGLNRYISFSVLGENREALQGFVSENYLLAALLYIIAYIVMAAFSLPGGAIVSVLGGFLFGWLYGTAYILLGATIGACLLFLAARYAFAELLREKAGKYIEPMRAGFDENAVSYMLFLRLVPLFPFFIVNLVPAFLNVRFATYAWTTAVGIIPGALVFASVGGGLGDILDRGETPDLGIILQPNILLPILGLAVLALLPVVMKKMRSSKGAAEIDQSGGNP